jgi:hypothetical protein
LKSTAGAKTLSGYRTGLINYIKHPITSAVMIASAIPFLYSIEAFMWASVK